MGPSAPQVFKDISPEQYSRLVEKAKASGIDLGGNSGTASKFGVEIAWTYVPDSQQLTIQCLKTPFFMSTSDIDTKIQTLVAQTVA
jgi:hypothetical protein